LILSGIVVSTLYLGGVIWYSFHSFPKTTINGMDVAMMGTKEMQNRLKSLADEQTIVFEHAEGNEQVKGKDIGLSYIRGKDLSKEVLDRQTIISWPSECFKKHDYELSATVDDNMLSEAIRGIKFHREKKIMPKNAKVAYDEKSGEYKIIPDKDGNKVDPELLIQKTKESVEKDSVLKISTENCFRKAKIRQDSKKVTDLKAKVDKWMSSVITIRDAHDNEIVIDKKVIPNFIDIDDYKATIDEDAIANYVNTKFDPLFDTVGRKRSFKSPGSGKISVSGGTYGAVVSTAKETEKLKEEIKSGKETARNPLYRIEEKGDNNDGIGDDYIDVDIADQTVYLIKNNKVVYQSPCVTGLAGGNRATPTGTYYISWKTRNWHMKRFNVDVAFWMPINDSTGVGLHDASWRGSFGGSIYRYNGSHGCINLPYSAAKEIYYSTPESGTPVIVH